MVDRHAVRRADLVLAAVALADRAALVVLGLHPRAQRGDDLPGDLGLAVLPHERQDGDLHRRQARVQLEHGALLAAELVLVVGVDEERERRAVGARRRLDDVRDVALLRLRIEVLELLAGVLGVLREVEVAAVGDALELAPADREEVLDVGGAAGVVRQLVGVVLAQAQVVLAQAEVDVPVVARLLPEVVPARRLVGRDEELHLHLLELARAKDEVAGRDLVAERLADLGDAERRLLAAELQDVLEVDEDALRGLGAQVGDRRRSPPPGRSYVSNMRLKSRASVRSWRRSSALGSDALRRAHLLASRWSARKRFLHARQSTIGSVKPARWPEASHVARVLEDRGVQGDDVVALLEHRAPPLVLDVRLQQDAVVAVVVRRAEAAVDLRRGEDEAAPLAQRDDLLHGGGVGHAGGAMLDNGPSVPFYEYRRQDGTTFEIMQKMVDPPLECDPETGLPVTRVFHPIAVHFKGKGFYNTDYGTKKRAREKDAHDSSKKKSEKSDSSSGDSRRARRSPTPPRRPRRRPRRPSSSSSDSSSSSSSSSSCARARSPPRPERSAREEAAHLRLLDRLGDLPGDRAEDLASPACRRPTSAPKRPSSVGPLMSERSALGTFQEISGSRANAIGDSSRRFIAPTIFCWRRARVRSSSFLLQRSCACAPAPAPACRRCATCRPAGAACSRRS